MSTHHHRPSSSLKQSNKTFKSRHTTKGALRDAAKGRTPRTSPKPSSQPIANSANSLRANRRNIAKQIQASKRQTMLDSKRLYATGQKGLSRLVTVISLTPDIDCQAVVKKLAEVVGEEIIDGKLNTPRFKTSIEFLFPSSSFHATLSSLPVSDFLLLLLSPEVEADEAGETLMRTMQSLGVPNVVGVVAPSTAGGNFTPGKKLKEITKSLLSFTQYFVPSLTRLFDLSSASDSDALNALRALCEPTPSQTQIGWRVGRAYAVAETLSFESHNDGEEGEKGRLAITGLVRGAALDPNRLVHVAGWGDYQVDKILSAPSLTAKNPSNPSIDTEEPIILAEPTPSSASSLVSFNAPSLTDELAKEQTWPEEDEMQQNNNGMDSEMGSEIPDAPVGTTPRRIKRVPKGMSEYQASWIVDSDGEDDDEGSEAEDGIAEGDKIDKEEMAVDHDPDDDETEEIETGGEKYNTYIRDQKQKDNNMSTHLNFPDELDTPLETPAQTRFARYRGLRSVRTSPWDPYENLPEEYGKIFSWDSKGDMRAKEWKKSETRLRKRVEKGWEEGVSGGVEPGTRVTIVLKNVPRSVFMHYRSASMPPIPLSLFSLHPHEHKQTVLNFTVSRNTEYEGSVRSKDPLILLVGPRKLRVNPIYSSFESGNPPPNNVHKFERYLLHNSTAGAQGSKNKDGTNTKVGGTNTYMATIYGPVVFSAGGGKVPCVLLKESELKDAADPGPSLRPPSTPILVASGTFHSPSTTRIIAKRVILTGHPFKVHKKTATVRYMFFNADDVSYFSPIQLYTKHGRTGHIKESLGTHGYFKAHFDGPVSQMDTVCMALYKRVYPKWSRG
ncbi:hypothetical protein BDP27DRAFT_1324276 [Rhodocollybia butyracea]|uniref:Bms1-type G domain-containing protein n=1 Tax=Rhodocollybia butyracea TaxID=206335 RepID=A0A9P5PVD1_9AGAR|nr:hypothetical protein BDP27DRAFT_1324276 [Rhodocollybia butyracea]